jgi:glycerol-3-phosphate dehydrogenase
MIVRDPRRASAEEFELVIVGGGIYGASLLREAARRGVSACLCEAQDFGGVTSQNSLRILHGGLRYLQTLDFRRFFQSVAARRSVALRFPRLVRKLPCLMPLYGPGLKRPTVMRVALAMNDLLSSRRNAGVASDLRLEGGETLSAARMREAFPQVRTDGLLGGARWTDYFMVSSERVLIEQLRDACRRGAVALNYARVEELLVESGAVRGVRVSDATTGSQITVRARQVVNCAGPFVRSFTRGLQGDSDALFHASLAFNVLLEASLPTTAAVAVTAPEPGATTLFLVPQKRTVLAGTMHLPRPPGTLDAVPTHAELEDYLRQLRSAVPGFDVRLEHVRRVFSGLLPARAANSAALVKREVIVDHGAAGGPRGFYTVSGVKYTTSGNVAARVMTALGWRAEIDESALPTADATALLTDAGRLWSEDAGSVREGLRAVASEECVQSLDDLIYRRSNWATTEPDIEAVRARLIELGMDDGERPRLSA